MQPRLLFALALAFCAGTSLYLAGRYQHLRNELEATRVRLASLENAVRKRDAADPLTAFECVQMQSGDTADNPCETTLYRLAQAPQQFHGTWVLVDGLYVGRFENSALHPLTSALPDASQALDNHAALWVQLELPGADNTLPMRVVGKFKRGPSGHMSDYFGELTDAKVHGIPRQVTR